MWVLRRPATKRYSQCDPDQAPSAGRQPTHSLCCRRSGKRREGETPSRFTGSMPCATPRPCFCEPAERRRRRRRSTCTSRPARRMRSSASSTSARSRTRGGETWGDDKAASRRARSSPGRRPSACCGSCSAPPRRGLAASFLDLMGMGWTWVWNRGRVPVTKALREQRERSLTGTLAWALDLGNYGREIHRRLACRVAGADERYLLPSAQLPFEGRSPVVDARSFRVTSSTRGSSGRPRAERTWTLVSCTLIADEDPLHDDAVGHTTSTPPAG
jgi:hypothetical protein